MKKPRSISLVILFLLPIFTFSQSGSLETFNRLNGMADFFKLSENVDKCIEYRRKAVDYSRTIANDTLPLIQSLLALAETLDLYGNEKLEAINCYQEILGIFLSQQKEEQTEMTLLIIETIIRIYHDLADYNNVIRTVQEHKEYLESIDSVKYNKTVSGILFWQASAYQRLGNSETAISYYKEVLAFQVFQRDIEGTLLTIETITDLSFSLEKYDEIINTVYRYEKYLSSADTIKYGTRISDILRWKAIACQELGVIPTAIVEKDSVLFDSLLRIKQMVRDGDIRMGGYHLLSLEPQCTGCENNDIQLLYNENKGYVLLHNSDYEGCIPYFQRTIQLYENLKIKSQNYLDAFVMIGYSYALLDDYKNAERYYRKALIKGYAVANKHYDFHINIFKNLAYIYEKMEDNSLAEACMARVNDDGYAKILYLNYWQTPLWNEIRKYEEAQRYEEVEGMYDKLIIGIKANEGDVSDKLAISLSYKAKLLSHHLNKEKEAQSLFLTVISNKDWSEEARQIIPFCYCNLVFSYAKSRDVESVDSILPIAMKYLSEINNEAYPPNTLYRDAGDGFYFLQDYNNAIKYYERYLQASWPKENGGNYELSTNLLGVSYLKCKKPRKAQRLLTDFLKVNEQRLYKTNPSLLTEIYHNLGRAYMLQGKTSEATVFLNKSKDLQIELSGNINERTIQYLNECNANN